MSSPPILFQPPGYRSVIFFNPIPPPPFRVVSNDNLRPPPPLRLYTFQLTFGVAPILTAPLVDCLSYLQPFLQQPKRLSKVGFWVRFSFSTLHLFDRKRPLFAAVRSFFQGSPPPPPAFSPSSPSSTLRLSPPHLAGFK